MGFREDMVYLSPAPLYHTAPQVSVAIALRMKSTAIVMEHFDPALYLDLVGRYRVTHSQVVPTMFTRMLKLPPEVRAAADLSSLEIVIHAAAPCPVPVKEQMIEWFGPILLEYYAASEGNGGTFITSEDWLAHKGSVGRGGAQRDPHPRRRGSPVPGRDAGDGVVRRRHRLRVLRRSREDGELPTGRRQDEHGGRRRATWTRTATSF